MPAGMALVEGARRQVMADGDPVVEHEALASPLALLGGHFLQILENAALEVVDLLESFLEHDAVRLLAAEAAGAEHGDLLVLLPIALLTHVLGELSEGPGLRINSPFKGAYGHLIVVAGVDQQHLRITHQVIPAPGL